MAKQDWVWMGRPAHFIGADECHFRLATYIPSKRVIVSTVGDYDPYQGKEKPKIPGRFITRPVDIGLDRKYETFVFPAVKAKSAACGCPYHIKPNELDSLPANDAKTATKNHYALCKEWDEKK